MVKKTFLLLLLFVGFYSCKKEKPPVITQEINTVTSYTYKELKPFLENKNDTTYVINFWATWCAPCVKELPYFEKINQQYQDKKVSVLLVSLDFPRQVKTKLIPFLNKNKLQSKVVLLDDVNEDVWIRAIDSTWSGAIPATLIYNAERRKFYKQSFDFKTLENEILDLSGL